MVTNERIVFSRATRRLGVTVAPCCSYLCLSNGRSGTGRDQRRGRWPFEFFGLVLRLALLTQL